MKISRKKSKIVWLIFVWIIIQTGVVFSANAGDIVITEFFYNKSGGNFPQYIELFNTTGSIIVLDGWKVYVDGVDIVETTFDIDEGFKINSLDYAVILGSAGFLQSFADDNENGIWDVGEETTTYCSSSHYDPLFYGEPEYVQIDSLFWSFYTFEDLSITSGTIKIFDDSSSSEPIDVVAYDIASIPSNFPVTDGRAAVFIIDPKSESAHFDNDVPLNWRSSKHASDYLFNGSSSDFGSPLSSNFITPTIWIDAKSNSNTDSCSYSYTDSLMICYPHSDGYPGGNVEIELTGTAKNYSDSPVSLDSLFWTINNETALSVGLSWSPLQPLLYDTNLTSYEISLFTWETSGLMGKTDTTIYIKEINEKPSVVTLNGQASQAEIHVFENTTNPLYAEVTDPELCSSINSPCNFDSLTFNSSFFDNSLPFIWTSNSIPLSSDTTSLVYNFMSSKIDSSNGISANNNPDTLEFQFKVTDPFGELDIESLRVIVHNKNQKPNITLDSTNINAIDIVAGYSNKFIVNGNQIELHELDASGVHTDTTIIGQITDIDNDLNFEIIPLGRSCDLEFENSYYCVSGATIKTAHKVSHDDLEIPFIVDDGVSSPIDGFASESKSDTAYLIIKNIKNVTHTVYFDDYIIYLDELFHLPEDSTLISEIPFYIDFKLDGNNTHEVNWDSLQWSFHKLDTEDEQRVYAYKTAEGFFIDSLFNNFNGKTGLKVFVTDNDNSANSLSDSIIINIPIFIDQRNDTLKQFNLYHDIINYSLDVSTIDTVREMRYFRLPQFANENNTSKSMPEKLRFEWEKNDDLDIDTDFNLNTDDTLNIFYRLELIDTLTNVVSILKDRLPHNDFIDSDTIWVEINLEGEEFPFYYDSQGYTSQLDTMAIDINGLSTYRWRVSAKNYWADNLGNDPYQISTGWDSTDFKIDLIQPKVSNMDIILNDMYPGYYDLLWNSSEAFLTDYTFLSINEKTNQFSAISMLNPRKITDNLFHLTGLIPTHLTSVTITFDLQLRDNAMNSGERIDEISYVKVSPDSVSTLISPSDNVSITLSKYSVLEPVQIIITEENDNILSRGNKFELIQITPTIHFYPKELTLNNPAFITFNMSDYISSEFEIWQLIIAQIIDNEPIQLVTNISDHFITASVNALGDYAVFLNSTLEKPLPSEFEIKMNYPNPFNPSTTIPIELPDESFVEVAIYNILGEQIVILSEGIKSSGYHNIIWNGTNQFGQPVSSGIYFVSVHLGQKVYHQKMMLLK